MPESGTGLPTELSLLGLADACFDDAVGLGFEAVSVELVSKMYCLIKI